MARQCIFCGSKAGSKEHVLPAWILRLIPRPEAIRFKLGNSPEKKLGAFEHKVGSVCDACNKGWMSTLEEKVKPTMGCMIQDLSLTLDESQQRDIAVWATKTAMVNDSTVASIRGLYYSLEDRQQIQTNFEPS